MQTEHNFGQPGGSCQVVMSVTHVTMSHVGLRFIFHVARSLDMSCPGKRDVEPHRSSFSVAEKTLMKVTSGG